MSQRKQGKGARRLLVRGGGGRERERREGRERREREREREEREKERAAEGRVILSSTGRRDCGGLAKSEAEPCQCHEDGRGEREKRGRRSQIHSL